MAGAGDGDELDRPARRAARGRRGHRPRGAGHGGLAAVDGAPAGVDRRDSYSAAYSSNQFRALQQFFKWLAAEDEIPDPMAGLRPPHVPERPVPDFDAQELLRLERACSGRSSIAAIGPIQRVIFRGTESNKGPYPQHSTRLRSRGRVDMRLLIGGKTTLPG
jgi:integrase